MTAFKSVGVLAIALAIGGLGCATESAAFRRMSATDHETAARGATDATVADEHAMAARRLRDDERTACFGVSESDREDGPLARGADITAVEVVRDRGVFPKGPLQPVGVSLYMRAEPGMTQQWLGRVVACHLAHIAVAGWESRPSPLGVPGAEVAVTSTPVGFRITMTSKDAETAREVVERARATYEGTTRAAIALH